MQFDEWGTTGLLLSGLVALIVALGRGWLLLPGTIQRSTYEDMRDDRNYWRREAHKMQRTARDAVRVRTSQDGSGDS